MGLNFSKNSTYANITVDWNIKLPKNKQINRKNLRNFTKFIFEIIFLKLLRLF